MLCCLFHRSLQCQCFEKKKLCTSLATFHTMRLHLNMELSCTNSQINSALFINISLFWLAVNTSRLVGAVTWSDWLFGAPCAVALRLWRFRSDAKLQFSRIIYYVLCLKILYAYGVICLRHKLERPCMGMMYISQRNALIVTELCIVQILTNLE